MAASKQDLAVGDRVRIGKGKQVWVVTDFGRYTSGDPYVAMRAEGGYTNTTADPKRVTKL